MRDSAALTGLAQTWGYITMSQAMVFTADMKLGHYMKIVSIHYSPACHVRSDKCKASTSDVYQSGVHLRRLEREVGLKMWLV